jgi:hypothetical protein
VTLGIKRFMPSVMVERWSAEDHGIKRLSVRQELRLALRPAAAKTTLG